MEDYSKYQTGFVKQPRLKFHGKWTVYVRHYSGRYYYDFECRDETEFKSWVKKNFDGAAIIIWNK